MNRKYLVHMIEHEGCVLCVNYRTDVRVVTVGGNARWSSEMQCLIEDYFCKGRRITIRKKQTGKNKAQYSAVVAEALFDGGLDLLRLHGYPIEVVRAFGRMMR